MVHKFVHPYLLNKIAKMMQEKQQIQEQNYIELINARINPIHARYVAFKLAELGSEIQEIEFIKELVYKFLCNKGCYLVTLPQIPIPDAKIELI